VAGALGGGDRSRVVVRAGYALEGTKRSAARLADGWHDMHLHTRLARPGGWLPAARA
jgi:hypothetical protein